MSFPEPKYRLEKKGEFTIENYLFAKPWSSFFPGIAGLFGIPMWAFYVNRGQAIASCGVRSKDGAIMEFLPANKAYQLTPVQGFRTFLKVTKGGRVCAHEPFSARAMLQEPSISNKIMIRAYDLTLEETYRRLGLKTEVHYFPLVSCPYAALVRRLTLKNISTKSLTVEGLDGLPVLVPCGVNNFFLKEMSRTIEAWMTVENISSGVPVFKLSTDPSDTAQVAFIKAANFYRAFSVKGHSAQKPLKVVVDPSLVFGQMLDLIYPAGFFETKKFDLPLEQNAKNKMPCAFGLFKEKLAAGQELEIHSIIGHVFNTEDIKKHRIAAVDIAFLEQKKEENRELIDQMMDRIFTVSSSCEFDLYARQTYLDNLLRGGSAESIELDGERSTAQAYVYSRKHGDLERDYNRFQVASTYFSEGEGNYRDVNQNRRMDVFFNPALGEKNVVDFLNLIQLDGYNPLIFKGDRYTVEPEVFLKSALRESLGDKEAHKLAHILSKPFVLGEILLYLQENGVCQASALPGFVKGLLAIAASSSDAAYGEGYWSDHWTYNTDLLESFSAVYPDRMRWLLLEKNDFTYFDQHAFVRPRSQRYVFTKAGLRQYHSIFHDEKKALEIQKRPFDRMRARFGNGSGEVIKTGLVAKLMTLILNKASTLDPCGVGIEMEADKPNWYDALNGLPGLFGSSVSETYELKRLVLFLSKSFERIGASDDETVLLVEEVARFLDEMIALLEERPGDFEYWDRSNTIKESYRAAAQKGLSCEPFRVVALGRMRVFFRLLIERIDQGLAKASEPNKRPMATYFSYAPLEHETLRAEGGQTWIKVKSFSQHRLPVFLEGFVHAMRCEPARAAQIYAEVKKSGLWDKKLRMYKVNASLNEESFELGRTKAFTPGWLENESIWLHMEYKYLLEILRSGLFQEFNEELKNLLIPFQDPLRYGRSILENSSFIASSAHPDASLHGTGFVARLSGSTAEFIHIWLLMNAGLDPFYLNGSGSLCLRLRPSIPGSFFTTKVCRRRFYRPKEGFVEAEFPKDTYSFLFLGRVLVTYHNPSRKNAFGLNALRPKRWVLKKPNGSEIEVNADHLEAPHAEMVRSGVIVGMDVFLR